jgi:hypothetical protein
MHDDCDVYFEHDGINNPLVKLEDRCSRIEIVVDDLIISSCEGWNITPRSHQTSPVTPVSSGRSVVGR